MPAVAAIGAAQCGRRTEAWKSGTRLQGWMRIQGTQIRCCAEERHSQRCLMSALHHARAKAIALVGETGDVSKGAVLELPPAVLRLIGGAMGGSAPLGRTWRSPCWVCILTLCSG
jgi:hypothetical protein